MIDPSLPLQKGIVARLKAHADVQAVAGVSQTRVYDAVPPGAAKPYINLGKPQVLPAKASCLAGAEVSYTIHGWAAGKGAVEIKQVGAAIVAALDEDDDGNPVVEAEGHRVVIFELEQMQYLDDPDGLTQHVAATFRAVTEPV